MTTNKNILDSAARTISSQSNSIAKLIDFLDDAYPDAVRKIFQTKGRIVVSGIGKSAIIAQKIVATFNSTGTPALFMHASEAIHGDLGMVKDDDTVICISKSGNSPEIKALIPLLKRFGNRIIAITGNMQSFLAQESDIVLNTYVNNESCPNNLAPTDSTTTQLVMGDALAVSLMELRDFSSEDFAKFHPGGALGKQLLLKVSDILDTNKKPIVTPETDVKKVIFEISEKRLGVAAVIENEKVIGIITDGDIRRMLNNTDTINGLFAKDIMSKNPKTIQYNAMAKEALNIMETYAITQLVVVNQDTFAGIIHLHDILKEGII